MVTKEKAEKVLKKKDLDKIHFEKNESLLKKFLKKTDYNIKTLAKESGIIESTLYSLTRENRFSRKIKNQILNILGFKYEDEIFPNHDPVYKVVNKKSKYSVLRIYKEDELVKKNIIKKNEPIMNLRKAFPHHSYQWEYTDCNY